MLGSGLWLGFTVWNRVKNRVRVRNNIIVTNVSFPRLLILSRILTLTLTLALHPQTRWDLTRQDPNPHTQLGFFNPYHARVSYYSSFNTYAHVLAVYYTIFFLSCLDVVVPRGCNFWRRHFIVVLLFSLSPHVSSLSYHVGTIGFFYTCLLTVFHASYAHALQLQLDFSDPYPRRLLSYYILLLTDLRPTPSSSITRNSSLYLITKPKAFSLAGYGFEKSSCVFGLWLRSRHTPQNNTTTSKHNTTRALTNHGLTSRQCCYFRFCAAITAAVSAFRCCCFSALRCCCCCYYY